MKKLFAFIVVLMFFSLPSYAQIWEGSGGQAIDEGIGFGSGGGTDIDWSLFTGDQCTITFRNNENTWTQSQVVVVGAPSVYVMSDIEPPEKSGYSFAGWSTSYPTVTTLPDNFTATTTYYAVYQKQGYTVYYLNPDNTLYTSQIYEYGDTIIEPTEPTYENDDFWDWNSLPYEMPGATFTVTAQVFPKSVTAYGLEVDLGAVSSATAYTYLYDSVGMTPVFVDNDGVVNNFGDSATSWKSFIYQYVKPCMLKLDGTVDYYLDTEDQSKRADGVTASDIADSTYQGNAMVEFTKLWSNARNVKGTNKYKLIISPDEINNITYAEAFRRADGTYADKVYYAMFQAGTATGRSATSLALNTRSKDNIENIQNRLSVLRQYAQSNGTGWDVTYEALTQHIYKLIFMIGKTVEPYGILFQKKHVNYVSSGEGGINDTDGVSNGCIYVQGNTNNKGLIKLLWINDIFGAKQYFQTGVAYYAKKVYLGYPPFSEQGTVTDYTEIGDNSGDSVYIGSTATIYWSRLGFYHGVAYENKFTTSAMNTAVLGLSKLYFIIRNDYRNGNYVMPSYRNEPARRENYGSSGSPISITYHHCGYNSNTSLYDSITFGFRLSYVPPSPNSRLLMNGRKSADTREYLFCDCPKIATMSSDIGEQKK